jgi:hypothetical protein
MCSFFFTNYRFGRASGFPIGNACRAIAFLPIYRILRHSSATRVSKRAPSSGNICCRRLVIISPMMRRTPRSSLPGHIIAGKVTTPRDSIPKSTPARLLGKIESSSGRRESTSCAYANLLANGWPSLGWVPYVPRTRIGHLSDKPSK